MPLLADLSRLDSAEEFFRYLQVEYDPAVLNVARLHILKRMGLVVARADLASLDEEAARIVCREALAAAYHEFRAHTPQEQRLFSVQRRAGLVPLGTRPAATEE
jgi:nitrogenase-stabilizing/protective protein